MANAVTMTSCWASIYDRGFCKTAFKPYDVAVTAALLIAKHHWGESFEIRSCGSDAQWWDAKLICQRVLGYGALFRFAQAAPLDHQRSIRRN
jgi:hypothetical protein